MADLVWTLLELRSIYFLILSYNWLSSPWNKTSITVKANIDIVEDPCSRFFPFWAYISQQHVIRSGKSLCSPAIEWPVPLAIRYWCNDRRQYLLISTVEHNGWRQDCAVTLRKMTEAHTPLLWCHLNLWWCFVNLKPILLFLYPVRYRQVVAPSVMRTLGWRGLLTQDDPKRCIIL